MKSIRLGRLWDTDIVLGASFWLVPALVVYSAFDAGDPQEFFRYLVTLFVAYGSVVAHEYGHIFMARKCGYRSDTIELGLLGGLAHMDRPAENWKDELKISIAGPLVNMAITGVGLLAALILFVFARPLFLAFLHSDYAQGAVIVLVINLFLGAFNLLPLYPMDGGRIVHALVWRGKSKDKAERISGLVGLLGGGLMMAFALLSSHYILALIALVVLMASFGQNRRGNRPTENTEEGEFS